MFTLHENDLQSRSLQVGEQALLQSFGWRVGLAWLCKCACCVVAENQIKTSCALAFSFLSTGIFKEPLSCLSAPFLSTEYVTILFYFYSSVTQLEALKYVGGYCS